MVREDLTEKRLQRVLRGGLDIDVRGFKIDLWQSHLWVCVWEQAQTRTDTHGLVSTAHRVPCQCGVLYRRNPILQVLSVDFVLSRGHFPSFFSPKELIFFV